MMETRRRAAPPVADALISGLAQLYGLTPRAIRHYEQLGLVATYRDRSNRRRYDARARARLQLIGELRAAGLALREFAPIVALDGRGRAAQLRAAAEALRRKLAEADEARERLTRAICRCEAELAPQERPSAACARLAAGNPGGGR